MFSRFRRVAVLTMATLLAAGALAGCSESEVDDFFNGGGGNVNAGPTAVNDAYEAAGNATLNVTVPGEGALANDITNGATVTAFDAVGTAGGAVAMAADGTFAYTPPDNTRAVDTFTYTITNANGASTATVTVTVNNLAFFVDNQALGGGNGSQDAPFNNLAAALAVPPQAGDAIFIAPGDGSTNGQAGAFTIPDGVSIFGGGVGLFFNNGITPRSDDVLAETIVPMTVPTQADGTWTLGSDTVVAGFEFISNGVGPSLTATGEMNIEVSDNLFNGPFGSAVVFVNVTGQVIIDGNEVSDLTGMNDGFSLFNNGTDVADIQITDNTLTGDAGDAPGVAIEMGAEGNSDLNVTISDNTVNNTAPDATSVGSTLSLFLEDDAQVDLTFTNNVVTNASLGLAALFTEDNSSLVANLGQSSMTNGGASAVYTESYHSSSLDLTATGNAIDSPGDEGFDLNSFDMSAVTALLDGNTMTDVPNTSFDIENNSTGAHDFTIVNNIVVNGFQAVESEAFNNGANHTTHVNDNDFGDPNGDVLIGNYGDGTACSDVSGNILEDIFLNNNGGGTHNVEQFDAGTGGPLPAVNTMSGTVMTTGTITPVADGTCP